MSAAAAVRSVVVEDFVVRHRNTLRGFARIALPSGLILSDVALHRKDDSVWAQPPSKPMLSADGVAMRDEAGKIRYVPIVSFNSKEARERFSVAVVEAVRASHPEALR